MKKRIFLAGLVFLCVVSLSVFYAPSASAFNFADAIKDLFDKIMSLQNQLNLLKADVGGAISPSGNGFSTISFTNTPNRGSYPNTITVNGTFFTTFTIDISALPQNAAIVRATLVPNRRPVYCNFDINIESIDAPGQYLSLIGPRYLTFDATDAVKRALASPSRKVGLKIVQFDCNQNNWWATSNTSLYNYLDAGTGKSVFRLDITIDQSLSGSAVDTLAVSNVSVRHKDGDTMITWKDPQPVFSSDTVSCSQWGISTTSVALNNPHEIRYRIYRSDQPITEDTISAAQLIDEVNQLTVWDNQIFGPGNGCGSSNIPLYPIDNGVLASYDMGIYVRHIYSSQNSYYAVIRTVDGIEDFSKIQPGQNATTSSVAETTGTGMVLLRERKQLSSAEHFNYVFGPQLNYYVKWEAPPDNYNVPSAPMDYLVAVPPTQPKGTNLRPVDVGLHCWGGSLNSCYRWWYLNSEGSLLVSTNDYPFDWWTGANTSYGTLLSYSKGVVVNTNQNRLGSFIDNFVIKNFPADKNKILLSGVSMGGTGASLWGMRQGNYFSHLLSGVGLHIPLESPVYTNSFYPYYGYPNWNIKQEGTNMSVWDYEDNAQWLLSHITAETPYMAFANGRNDTGIGWPQAWKMAKAMVDTKRPFNFFWGQSAHGQMASFPGGNDIAQYPGMVFRANQSVPAFANGSLDSGSLGTDPNSSTDSGSINYWYLWDTETITDQAGKWEMTIFLPAKSTLGSVPPDTATVDLTPRRLQSFSVIAGKRYAWTNTENGTVVQNGVVTADSNGLITIPALRISKNKNRISVVPTDAQVEKFTLITTSSTGGTVTVSPIQATYDPGAKVTLTAVVDPGYTFSNWSGNLAGSQNPVIITMDSNKSIKANFTVHTYSITASAGSNGTVSPSGNLSENHGSNQTFTITPNLGYKISSVLVDGVSIGTVNTYTFSNITAPHTISASFASDPSNVKNHSTLPNTSDKIHLFSDQLTDGIPQVIVNFIATHADGVQKMVKSENTRYKNINPNWVLLHYRLAVSSGPVQYIHNNIWSSDWTDVNPHEDWFLHNENNQRHHDGGSNWDTHDLLSPGLRQYWINNVISDMRATGAQGVFADSFTAGISGYGVTSPDARFSGTNPANPSYWPNGYTWTEQLRDWANYVRGVFSQTPERFLYIPNVGSLITVWDDTDLSKIDGAMLESFASPSFSTADWILGINRALPLSAADKILLCETYPSGTKGTAAFKQNVDYMLGSYLLIKGNYTYIDLRGGGGGNTRFYYYPEYDLDFGLAIDPLPANISQYLVNGAYQRKFQKGRVIVNPGASAVTVPLGATMYQAIATGGGEVNSSTDIANNKYVGGSISYSAVTSVVLPAKSAAFVFNSIPSGNNYTIAATAGANGSISPSGTITVGAGSSQTFTITPSNGYSIQSVLVDGVSVGTPNTYTFTNVTSNRTISASFTSGTAYTLITLATNGTIAKNPDKTSYNSGETVVLTANPNTGYVFTGWSGDLSGAANPSAIIMNNNKSVTANFSPMQAGNIFLTETWGNKAWVKHASTLTVSGNNMKFNLSAIPSSSRITRAVLKVPRLAGSSWIGESITVVPIFNGAQGTKLAIRPPLYNDFIATDAVQSWITNPSSNSGFQLIVGSKMDLASAVLEISFAGSLGTSLPLVSDLTAKNSNGQTFLTWKEISDPLAVDMPTIPQLEEAVNSMANNKITYRIYRSKNPITANNLYNAELVREVPAIVSAYNLPSIPRKEFGGSPTFLIGGNRSLEYRIPRYNITENAPLDQYQGDVKQYDLIEKVYIPATRLPKGYGLAVLTNHSNGNYYYAVIASVNGLETVSVLDSGSSLASPVSEIVGTPAPIPQISYVTNTQVSTYKNITFEKLIYWLEPPYHNLPDSFIVSAMFPTVPSGASMPLTAMLDGWGYGADMASLVDIKINQYIPGSILIEPADSNPSSMFQGYHEAVNTYRGFNDGIVNPYPQRIVDIMIYWAKQKFLIDNDSIYLNGQFALWGLRNPGSVNAILGDGYGNFNIGGWNMQNLLRNGYWGPYLQGSLNDQGANELDWINISKWLIDNPKEETPFISVFPAYGSHVGDMGWKQVTEFYRALENSKRPFTAWWGSSNGQNVPLKSILSTIKKNQSLPAFANFSLDKIPFPDDAVLCANGIPPEYFIGGTCSGAGCIGGTCPSGTINGYTYWETNTITDQPNKWEMTIYLPSGAPQTTATVDLTPRRLQSFSVVPGGFYNWTNTSNGIVVQNGTAIADSNGLLTITGLQITKSKNRISIVPTVPVATHTITVSAGANGTISPNGNVIVADHSNQTFTITANSGYQIADVLIDSVSVGAVSTHAFNNVTTNHTISASFTAVVNNTYTLNAIASNGTVAKNPNLANYTPGTVVTLTASPNPGYVFTGWSQDLSGSVNPTTITMNANKNVTANFQTSVFTIDATAGSNGSIIPSGSVAVPKNSNQTFIISANSGYRISNLIVDNVSQGALSSYTFTNVIANHTISASFAANPANNPPKIFSIGNKSVIEGDLLKFSVLATDSDNDALTYSVVNLPQGASFNNQEFSWTPSQKGTYSVIFKVSDGKDLDSETVIIKVNEKPIASCQDVDDDGIADYDAATCPTGKDKCIVKESDLTLPQLANYIPVSNRLLFTLSPLKDDIRSLTGFRFSMAAKAQVEFQQKVKLLRLRQDDGCFDKANLDDYVDIQDKKVKIDSSLFPELNKKATITFYNITFKNPVIKRDGQVCSNPECKIVSYDNNTLIVEVSGFSEYVIEEGQSQPSGAVGSTGATTQDTVAPSPTDVLITGTSSSSAKITWKTDEPSETWLVYGTTSSYGQEIKEIGKFNLLHEANILNLSPGTYHFSVKTKDIRGNTALSSDRAFTLSSNGVVNEDQLLKQIADLTDQINKIRALIASLTSRPVITNIPSSFTFTTNLKQGMFQDDVMYLQILLNSDPDTRIKATSIQYGYPGKESKYFGKLTTEALIRFQEKYASEILTPYNLTKGTGFVGNATRAKLNKLLGK